MNDVIRTVNRFGLLLSGLALAPIPAVPATNVGGTLSTPTTWTVAGSPFLMVDSVLVAEGVTLTIEPGVEVRSGQYKFFTIDGALVAEGSEAKPIVFRGTTQTAGWWSGLHIRNAGTVTLEYCEIQDAGYWHEAGILKQGSGSLSLRHSVLRGTAGSGLILTSGATSFLSENNQFRDNGFGLRIGPNTTFSDTTSVFLNNAIAPVAVDGGTHTMDVSWELSSNVSILLRDNQIVAEGATLTLKPGLVVKSAQYKGFVVDGLLVAEGLATKPIHLSGYRDDTVGGDTNGDGTTTWPTPGWWAGIKVRNSGSARLAHATVAYSGYWDNAGIFKSGTGDLRLSHCALRETQGAGLRLHEGSGLVLSEDNQFVTNAHGVRLGINTSFKDTTSVFSGNSVAQVAVDGGTHTRAVSWELSPAYAILLSDNQTVAAGATLTLQPGLILKSAQYKGITVDGRLVAEGTATEPIHMTSHRDDSVGGDSNHDGTGTNSFPGWWSGVKVRNSGSGVFAHVTVSHAGYWDGAAVLKSGSGSLSLTDSTLESTDGAGLRLGEGSLAFISQNNRFRDNHHGVRLGINTSFQDDTSTFADNSFAPVAADGGTQTLDVSWELSSDFSIVLLDNRLVAEGASLTLLPGLVVKSVQYKNLAVEGLLEAVGTAEEPIHFSSHRDDSVGGDANNDGTATTPTAGWWMGIDVRAAGSAALSHATVSHAGYWNEAGVFKRGSGDLRLSHSTIRHTAGAGLRLTGGYRVFLSENNLFANNRQGVRLGLNTSFADSSSVFLNNPIAPATVDGGTHNSEISWALSPQYSILVSDNQTIGAEGLLTLMPGLVVKFPQYKGIAVDGQLIACGTPGGEIRFADYRDDSVGGDTNNDGELTGPGAGWWSNLKIRNGGRADFAHIVVSHAGYWDKAGILGLGTAEIVLTDSEVRSIDGSGLQLQDFTGNAEIRRSAFRVNTNGTRLANVTTGIVFDTCSFEENRDYGVLAVSSSEADARGSWWGDPSGPYHPSLNPDGTGDRVSDGVLFDPWRTSRDVEGILSPVRSGTLVAGDSLRFSGSEAPDPSVGYLWSFGDGRSATVRSPGLLVYPTTGDFEVSYALVTDSQTTVFPETRQFAVVANTGEHPDLRLDRLEFPSSVGIGEEVQVSYNATNVGLGDLTEATWVDRIYLSKDAFLDTRDVLLSEKTVTAALDSGEIYEGSLSLTLPAMEEGARHLILSVNDDWAVLERHRLNNEKAAAVSVQIPLLVPGEVFTGSHESGRTEQYFRISANFGDNLVLDFNHGNSPLNAVIRHGRLPTRGLYDFRLTDSRLVIPAATAGVWYILVFGDAPATALPFTLKVSADDLVLTGATPRSQSAAAPLDLTLEGAGFSGGVTVDLIDSQGGIHPADSTIIESFTVITAGFEAGRLAPGRYDVRVAQGASTATLDDAVEIVSGGAPEFHVDVITPSVMGYHQLATLFVEYENRGNAPMPAPLLLLTPRQNGTPGALMTLDRSLLSQGFWTSAIPKGFATSIRLLAGGSQPGVLMPGESMRVPVYYAGWLKPWDFSYPPFEFKVVDLNADDTRPVPWAALKDNLMPAGTDADAWSAIWQNFTASVGTTVGDFVSALSRDAIYLSKIGSPVNDVNALLAFEVVKARGLIGPLSELTGEVDLDVHSGLISLQFGRTFPRSITQRYRLGPMGYGWNHTWEVRVDKEADGTIVMTRGNGATRVYQPDSRGGVYFSGRGDDSRLTTSGDSVVVTLKNGTRLRFDASGRLVRNEDRYGNAIGLHYANGLLDRLEHTNGLKILLSYNGSGLLSRVDDSHGNWVTYAYGAGSRLVSMVDSRRGSTEYTYSDSSDPRKRHALTGLTRTGGIEQTFDYDERGRLRSIVHGLGSQTYTYNQGDLSIADGAGHVSTASFNHLGAMTRMVDAESGVTTIVTDEADRTTTIRSPDGSTMRIIRDRSGQVASQVNQNGDAWTFETGRLGQIERVVTPEGRVRVMRHDGVGNLTSLIEPDGSQTRFEYDGSGRLTRRISPWGVSETLTYNAVGRVTKKATSGGSAKTFEFDAKNRLVKATSVEGDTVFTYDSAGNLTKVAYPNGLFIKYGYDAAGRVTSTSDQNGRTCRYAYNGLGLLDRLENIGGDVLLAYEYDGAGRLSAKHFSGGSRTVYVRNGRGQIVRQTTFDSGYAVLADFEAEYDAAGSLITYRTPEGTTRYTRDAVGRVVEMVHSPESGDVEKRTYARSRDGILEKLTIDGKASVLATDSSGRITSIGGVPVDYDATGNVSVRGEGADAFRYLRDVEGRVTRIETPSGDYGMRYDALGTLLSVESPTQLIHYLHDGIGKGTVFGEYDADGNPIRTYVHGLGIAVVNFDGSSYFPEYDPIEGETILAMTNSGNTAALGGHPTAADQPGSHVPFVPPYGFSDPFLFAPGGFGWVMNGLIDFASPVVREQLQVQGFGVRGSRVDQVLGILTDDKTPEGSALSTASNRASYAGLFGAFMQSADGIARWTNTVVTITDIPPRAFEAIEFLSSEGLGNALAGFGLAFNGLEILDGISDTWKDNRSIDWSDVANPFGSLDSGTHKIRHGLASAALTVLGLGASTAVAPVAAIAGIAAFISDNTGGLQEDFWIWWDGLDVTGETIRGPAMAGSQDPNQKLGVAGYGPANHVAGDRLLVYRIDFENHPDATAPVQVVTLRDRLPAETDWTTFELVEIGFGDISVPIAPDTTFFETVVDYAYQDDNYDFGIEVHVKVGIEDGEISALFYSIDPATGLPPPVEVGFLPPEPEKGEGDAVPGQGRGQGHLTYSVKPKPNLPDGTEIRNVATIQFDFSLEIDTNQVDPLDASKGIDPAKEALHTIDATPPTATVASLAPQSGRDFTVTWSGADPGGSGVAFCDVYVSVDGGDWKPWLKRTGETSASFQGESGHSYAFYAHATDGVGHSSLLAPTAQAQTIAGVSYLMNISNRGGVGTGPNVMIPGFVINGTGTKRVMIRAVGPRLQDFGLTGVLPDPQLTVFQGKTEIAANDDWADAPNAGDLVEAAVVVGAFDLKPEGKDAAALLALEPSAYSVKVSGVGGVTGVALVEVYDADEADATTAKIINISNRGQVGVGSAIMIPGFVVGGDGAKTVLIRGVGPRLADFGVNGTLEDPTLTVFQGKDSIGTNNDWGDGTNAAEVAAAAAKVGAFDLVSGSRDAAVVLTLEPGTYTVKVSGVGGATGVALVEIYEVPE